MRDSDTVGRLGGDSLGVLPAGETDVEEAAAIAWKVREVFEHPFLITGDAVQVEASIGIALFLQHGRSTSTVVPRSLPRDPVLVVDWCCGPRVSQRA